MIAPVNVIPPQLQPVDRQQVNPKNINANIQQSDLSVTAANSPDLLAPPPLPKSVAAQAPTTPTQSVPLFSPTAAPKLTVVPPLVTPAADVKALPAPSKIVPPSHTGSIQLGTNLAQNDPAPLPPPSEVTPQPPTTPSTPIPTGRPPVEPANYPQSTNIYYNRNYIGPGISFGKGSAFGAVSRFGLAKNISIRPSIFFGDPTRVAVPLTYDFDFNENEAFERNPLVILHFGGGVDYRSASGSKDSQFNPLVVFGADVYLGDGASVLLQLGSAFNSDFSGIVGVGLQF